MIDVPSDHSLWKNNLQEKSVESGLNEDMHCDVCIIGAGISGLTVAYQLLNAGKSVVIVDSRSMGENETGNTSAHLSNALDDRYFNIEKMHGKSKAKLISNSHAEAINFIETLCQQELIACDFKRVEGVLFTDEKILKKEFSAAKRCGIEVSLEERANLGKCLIFENQAQFHPLKYLAGLINIIRKKGGKIYFNTHVVKIEESPLSVILKSNNKIISQRIVTCTNSQFYSNLTMHFKLNPQRSYVIGINIPKNAVPNALYWDNEDPYHYVRVASKDAKEDILIIGGEDHRVGGGINVNAYKKLQEWAKKYFPVEFKNISYQWSGQILEPIDYIAYIGKNPKNPYIYMATGDSGNGLTHGTIAGLLIADDILQKFNPYAAIYQLKRMPFRAIKNMLLNLFSSMRAYFSYLNFGSRKMPKKSEGKIVQCGFKKIAVYKDDGGTLHCVSAVCTHLKGMLEWNPVEKSWDCPAHGSRFDTEGNILNGPAMQPLPKKQY